MVNLRTLSPEQQLGLLQDGLAAVESLQTPLSEVGFDGQALHDLQAAIRNNNLVGFVKSLQGRPTLHDVLTIMVEMRDLAKEATLV